MSRPNLTEILDICLQRVQAGSTVEEAIAAYPEQKEDLRVLLMIALDAVPSSRETGVPASAQVNSRRRFLARAQQIQERPGSAGLWSLINFVRAHTGSLAFTLAAVLLLFLALSSVQALPGDGLYPVKLAAEQAGVELAPSTAEREQRESAFDYRRADEVALMIQAKRTGAVAFGGFLSQAENGQWRVAGIPLQAAPELDNQTRGLSGVYVEVTGALDAQGEVQVKALQPRLEPLAGVIEEVRPDGWLIDGRLVRVSAITRVTGTARTGSSASIQAARIENSGELLAVYAEVNGGVEPSPTPTTQVTNTPTPTPTASPTARPTVTATAAPNTAPASADDSGGETDPSDDESDDEDYSESGSDDHAEDDKKSEDDGKDH